MLPYGLFDLTLSGGFKHVCKAYADREGIDVSRVQFVSWTATGDRAVALLNVFDDDFPTPHSYPYRRLHTDELFKNLTPCSINADDLLGNLVKYFKNLAVEVKAEELTYSLFDNKVTVSFDNPIVYGNYVLPIDEIAPGMLFGGTQLA